MKLKQKLVILVPTYNEIENIGSMLEKLDEVLGKLKNYKTTVLVIDDNSPDGTARLAKNYKANSVGVRLLIGKKNGLGTALVKGYKYAINVLSADLVGSIDADFLFSPRDLPKLVKLIEKGYDVAIGSRHHKGGFKVANWPLSRYITHWIANDLFAKIIAGNREVIDHNGNFRVIKSDLLKKINWAKVPTKGYGFLNYMIYEMNKFDAKFVEIPVKLTWRTRGESKVSFNPRYLRSFMQDTFEYILICFRIRFERIYSYLRQLPLYNL